jgi:hypothetical protein
LTLIKSLTEFSPFLIPLWGFRERLSGLGKGLGGGFVLRLYRCQLLTLRHLWLTARTGVDSTRESQPDAD